jgi:hypothetical protein
VGGSEVKIRVAAGLLVLASFSGAPAYAGPFGDEMAKCLVRTTTEADRTLLIQWLFTAMATHPDVNAMSNVSTQKGEELSKKVAQLFVTLVADRCKSETAQAVKYEGSEALTTSFEVLGQVAMQGIMSDPAVSGYLGHLQQYVDKKAVEEVFAAKK